MDLNKAFVAFALFVWPHNKSANDTLAYEASEQYFIRMRVLLAPADRRVVGSQHLPADVQPRHHSRRARLCPPPAASESRSRVAACPVHPPSVDGGSTGLPRLAQVANRGRTGSACPRVGEASDPYSGVGDGGSASGNGTSPSLRETTPAPSASIGGVFFAKFSS